MANSKNVVTLTLPLFLPFSSPFLAGKWGNVFSDFHVKNILACIDVSCKCPIGPLGYSTCRSTGWHLNSMIFKTPNTKPKQPTSLLSQGGVVFIYNKGFSCDLSQSAVKHCESNLSGDYQSYWVYTRCFLYGYFDSALRFCLYIWQAAFTLMPSKKPLLYKPNKYQLTALVTFSKHFNCLHQNT